MFKEKSAYTFIDLFCGAGGVSFGFCLSKRFLLLGGIDHDPWALRTFYANHPVTSTHFNQPTDISRLSGQELLSGLGVEYIDVVIGGPPCQGFSVAGKRTPDDHRNRLVWEYYRLISELRPQAFLMENVPGLLLAKDESGEKLTDVLQRRYEGLGYQCSLWRLNAADYGVPQVRKRTFLVGILGGPAVCEPLPTTTGVRDLFNSGAAIVTVTDALSDLPTPIALEPQSYNGSPSTDYQTYLREGSMVLYNHTPSTHKPDMVERLRTQMPGTRLYPNWNHSWYRLVLDRPAPTVKENHRATFVHPTEPRVTTPRECARLQSFPDGFIFHGTKTAQLIQIGNAVPPLLARVIAQEIALALDKRG